MMKMAEELRDYLSDLSRRVDCMFVDLDGGRWMVSELEFFGEQIWVRARPASSQKLSAPDVPSRVFQSDVRPGTRLEFVLDDGAVVQLSRNRSDGELRLKLKNGNGAEPASEDATPFFGQEQMEA